MGVSAQSREYLIIETSPDASKYSIGAFIKYVKQLWNDDEKEFMNRSVRSWFKLILFYWCFWWSLAVFFIVAVALFGITIDYNYPRYHPGELYLEEKNLFDIVLDKMTPVSQKVDPHIGLMLPSPGMAVRPSPDYRSTLIRFVQGRPSSYKLYTDHIQAFLQMYENPFLFGDVFSDCNTPLASRNKKDVCQFSLGRMGQVCTWQRDFGYDDGQPCVLLKLNKIYGWEPILYPDNSSVPEAAKGQVYKDHIGVTCEGESPMDQENIGKIEYYPREGLPAKFYPYLNQEGYQQPLVFIKFMRPANGVLINVWCKAWAKNILHHRQDRVGSIHFELLVD